MVCGDDGQHVQHIFVMMMHALNEMTGQLSVKKKFFLPTLLCTTTNTIE